MRDGRDASDDETSKPPRGGRRRCRRGATLIVSDIRDLLALDPWRCIHLLKPEAAVAPLGEARGELARGARAFPRRPPSTLGPVEHQPADLRRGHAAERPARQRAGVVPVGGAAGRVRQAPAAARRAMRRQTASAGSPSGASPRAAWRGWRGFQQANRKGARQAWPSSRGHAAKAVAPGAKRRRAASFAMAERARFATTAASASTARTGRSAASAQSVRARVSAACAAARVARAASEARGRAAALTLGPPRGGRSSGRGGAAARSAGCLPACSRSAAGGRRGAGPHRG